MARNFILILAGMPMALFCAYVFGLVLGVI